MKTFHWPIQVWHFRSPIRWAEGVSVNRLYIAIALVLGFVLGMTVMRLLTLFL